METAWSAISLIEAVLSTGTPPGVLAGEIGHGYFPGSAPLGLLRGGWFVLVPLQGYCILIIMIAIIIKIFIISIIMNQRPTNGYHALSGKVPVAVAASMAPQVAVPKVSHVEEGAQRHSFFDHARGSQDAPAAIGRNGTKPANKRWPRFPAAACASGRNRCRTGARSKGVVGRYLPAASLNRRCSPIAAAAARMTSTTAAGQATSATRGVAACLSAMPMYAQTNTRT